MKRIGPVLVKSVIPRIQERAKKLPEKYLGGIWYAEIDMHQKKNVQIFGPIDVSDIEALRKLFQPKGYRDTPIMTLYNTICKCKGTNNIVVTGKYIRGANSAQVFTIEIGRPVPSPVEDKNKIKTVSKTPTLLNAVDLKKKKNYVPANQRPKTPSSASLKKSPPHPLPIVTNNGARTVMPMTARATPVRTPPSSVGTSSRWKGNRRRVPIRSPTTTAVDTKTGTVHKLKRRVTPRKPSVGRKKYTRSYK